MYEPVRWCASSLARKSAAPVISSDLGILPAGVPESTTSVPAPVTMNVLPSNLRCTDQELLNNRTSAIDIQDLPGDEACPRRAQKQHRIHHFLQRSEPAGRNQLDQGVSLVGVV